MNNIKAIIFDFDGTLYQGEHIFTKEWTKACANAIDTFFKHFTSEQKQKLYQKYGAPFEFNGKMDKTPGQYCADILVGEGFSINEWVNYWQKNVYVEDWSNVTNKINNELLKTLSQEYSLYIVTNSPIEQVREFAKHLNIKLSYFKQIYNNFTTRWQSGTSKEIYYSNIINEEGLKPQECLVIGDHYELDLIPAKQLGLHTLWVENQSWDYNKIFEKLENLKR